ncbi:MAG: DeoR/GlpR family DNA-binding transcription regulator [Parvibaculaceae bacterium]
MTDRSLAPLPSRQDEVLRIVLERGRVSVDELADGLGASRETIRRDLKALSASGAIRKFHGGAMAPEPEVEGSFRSRMGQSVASKRRIAHAARQLFAPGDTLFIDTGSTTLLFAEALQQVPGLSVVTNSAAIAQVLSRPGTGTRTFLLGGEYVNDNQQTVGPLAIAQIGTFHMRHAVLTVAAVGLDGAIMDFSFEEAQVARAMIAQASTVTVLADSTKIGLRAPYEVCRLPEVDRLVTEGELPPELSGMAASAGVEIIVSQS